MLISKIAEKLKKFITFRLFFYNLMLCHNGTILWKNDVLNVQMRTKVCQKRILMGEIGLSQFNSHF